MRVMIRFLILILLIVFAKVYATDGGKFKYDDKQLDAGTMYIYELSKSESYEPHNIYLYLLSKDTIEVFVKGRRYNYCEKFVFDYDYMMMKSMEFNIVGMKKEEIIKKLKIYELYDLKADVDFKNKEMKTRQTNFTKDGLETSNEVKDLDEIPTYFYSSTTGIDMWFLLRFYPIKAVQELVVNYYHDDNNYEAKIEYEEKEQLDTKYGKVTCHKFEIYPDSFFWKLMAKKNYIWLSADENSPRYMVKYINENPLNAFQPRCEYNFVERNACSRSDWEGFKNSGSDHIEK